MRMLPAVAVLLALGGGCSVDEDAGAGRSTAHPDLVLAFTQLLPDEGTERGLLRVRNDSSAPIEITGVGLDWPGYGEAFRQDKHVRVEAGRTMDLKLVLPEPVCEKVEQPVHGIVEVDGRSLRQPLSSDGQAFLRHLWGRQCSARFVAERLDITYGDRWSQRGPDGNPRAVGVLRLTRVAGDERVELLGVQGSVLYGFALTGGTRLDSGQDVLEAPVAILPGDRCDEHARGRATAPFTFRLTLLIGDAPPGKVLVPPPPAGQAAATTVLDRACGPL